MSLIERYAVQTVGLRRLVSESSGWGEGTYEPAPPNPPLEIAVSYEPGYSDSGRDGERRFRGRVLTETQLNLGDLIIGDLDVATEDAQEVTDVALQYRLDGSVYFWEALL